MTLTPYQGGGKLLRLSGAAGVAGLVIAALGGVLGDPRRALFGYLVAFVYWLGIALGALILLGAFHASNARWPVVLRRFLETCREHSLLCALAGSLRGTDFDWVRDLQPDVVGVRGAACNGDRVTGRISSLRVRQLRAALLPASLNLCPQRLPGAE